MLPSGNAVHCCPQSRQDQHQTPCTDSEPGDMSDYHGTNHNNVLSTPLVTALDTGLQTNKLILFYIEYLSYKGLSSQSLLLLFLVITL